MSDIFERATRQKLRFETPKGLLSVEELWGLPLERGQISLDSIAEGLDELLNRSKKGSFVNKERSADPTIKLRFDIVLHIINVRLAEDEARAASKAEAERQQKILEIIAVKEDDHLRGLPIDELRALARRDAVKS